MNSTLCNLKIFFIVRLGSIVPWIICLLFTNNLFAQDIEVKKFEPLQNDQTAVTSARKDLNGNTCGLVKVILKEPGAEFEGNIIGDVTFNNNEYWVYMAKGSKRLNIKHPSYLPVTIVFSDYGVTRIESDKTYCLTLKGNKKNERVNSGKKKMVLFNIRPREAELYIDDEIISKEDGGTYAISLTHGTHYYSIKSGEFSLNNQVVKVSGKTDSVNVDLSVFYSKLCFSCETQDASLYINGKQYGNGSWSGLIAPGRYVLEAKKNACTTQTRTIEIHENDSVYVKFPRLMTITGKITVNSKPEQCDVMLDGEKVGKTPLAAKDVPVGSHQIIINKEYYAPDTLNNVIIEEGQDLTIEGHLDYLDEFSKIWIEAHNGNARYQTELAECYIYNKSHISGWDISMVDGNKAIYWYTKAAEQGYANAQCALSHLYNSGRVVMRNYEKSFYWAKKAAEQNDSQGCYLLGHTYAYGQGVEKDITQAIYWLRKSILIGYGEYGSGSGNSNAEELLKKLGYESEIPSEYDIE